MRRHFALTAIGRDRPGIVAAVTEVLLEHGLNIEDSQMTILGGHFTMMLVVAAGEGLDEDRLRTGLERARHVLELEAISLSEVGELDTRRGPSPSHIVTVYGLDHPGIVHAVAAALARLNVNITDLNTRLVAAEEAVEEPLYAMMLEVSLPADLPLETLDAQLRDVGAQQGVDVSVRDLEQDAL